MSWQPEIYTAFKKEREEPFEDLKDLLYKKDGISVIDLGCGTGNLTIKLSELLSNCKIVGIDTSKEMIDIARNQSYDNNKITFRIKDINNISGKWDLIFSNAALQWVNYHEKLFSRLIAMLKENGQLLVQIPSGHESLSLIKELASEEPYRSGLNNWVRRSPSLNIDEYAKILFDNGCSEINVYEKVYPHVLDDPVKIAQWAAGAALVPYFERMNDDLCRKFYNDLETRLKRIYKTGPILFGFRRKIISGVNKA